jgi:glycosyltransferase involved in cell wall biosynthesis
MSVPLQASGRAMNGIPRGTKLRVCHVAMADLWAGAEVQLAILLRSLGKIADLEVSAILLNRGWLSEELRAAGIKTHVIPETERNPMSIVRELSDYFRRERIDILHTHKYKDNILGALASIYRNIPYRVRTIHGASEPFSETVPALKMIAYEMVDGAINRWAVDRLLAVSLALKDSLVQRFGVDKVSCIHNAVDISRIRVRRDLVGLRSELGLDQQDFVVGTMCRLVPVKGLEVFLRAARLIRGQTKRAKFIVAGDGPLASRLQTLAQQYGLARDVVFLGHRNDGHDVLGVTDLFVLPSLSEGIPIVLLEALALSRPVVASRVGGIPEVVEHEVSGLLVEAGKEDELARECLRLMDDGVLARRLGCEGRKRVEKEFSAEVMSENVANVYRTLMAPRKCS